MPASRSNRIWPALVVEVLVTAAAVGYLHGVYRPLAAAAGLFGLTAMGRSWGRQKRL